MKSGPQPQKGLLPRGDSPQALGFKVFLAGGSDAHGELNYEATMDVTDFLTNPSRALTGCAEDNAMGRISTVVHAPAGMGAHGKSILRALHEGWSALSNGPLLIMGFDRHSNGNLDDSEDVGVGEEISSVLDASAALQLEWLSSEELGPVSSIRLAIGTSAGETPPEEFAVPSSKNFSSGGLVPVDLRSSLSKNLGGWGYVRLEARTRNRAGEEFRCYTNSIWVRVGRE